MLVMPWSPKSTRTTVRARKTETLPAQPLARQVREALLQSIVAGEFAPGDRITEPELAERLKVSRVPVREAMRELESAGLLESRKHTGVFVRKLSAAETRDLYELRALLEGHCARVAAGRRDEALVEHLAVILEGMERAASLQDLAGYYNGNLAFHWAIVQAAGNDQMAETYQGLVQKLHLARLTNLSTTSGIKRSQREHLALLRALRQGRADDAWQLASEHVLAAGRRASPGPDPVPDSDAVPELPALARHGARK